MGEGNCCTANLIKNPFIAGKKMVGEKIPGKFLKLLLIFDV